MTLSNSREFLRARPAPRRRGGIRALLLLSASAGVATIGGCKSYTPQPLDVEASHRSWLARSPSEESVRQFAERIAFEEGSGTETSVFNPSDGLTLAEAVPVALVFNRELRLARLRAGVSLATAENAGRWDDPVLGFDLERIVSGGPDPWVVLGSVGLTIPVSGRLRAEREHASAEHLAELQRIAAKEWATRAELRELWIEWSAQSHRARLTEELVDRLSGVATLAGRQEEAGVLSRVDARVFHIEVAASEAALILERARAKELELQLHDLMGLAPDAPVQMIESIAFLAQSGNSPSALQSMTESNLELQVARSEYEVAEERLRLEIRKQYPDLAVGPGYGTDQGDEKVLLGVQIPLPVWNRNKRGVAEALASREAARGHFESTYEELVSRLRIASLRYESGRSMREAVEARVVPIAEEQAADARRIAESGRVDALPLLQTIRSQHDAKVRLIDARAAEAIGAIRLETLIGPSLVRDAHSPESTTPAHPAPVASTAPIRATEGGRP